jgi:hypothetical protein
MIGSQENQSRKLFSNLIQPYAIVLIYLHITLHDVTQQMNIVKSETHANLGVSFFEMPLLHIFLIKKLTMVPSGYPYDTHWVS